MPAGTTEEDGEGPLEFGELSAQPPASVQSEPGNSARWEALVALGLWLLSLLLIVLLPNLVALPYIFSHYKGAELAQQKWMSDPKVLLLSVIGIIPAHIITFFVAWVIVTRMRRRPFWRTLNWSFSPRFGFTACAVLAVALYFASAVLAKLIGGGETDIEVLVNSSTATRITLAVLAVATGPLVEEIVYRGVLYSALEKTFGVWWSVLSVSFLFMFVHTFQYRNNLGVITVIGLLSVSLTLTRAITGRLLPCFIIHLIFNGIQSLLIVFQPYIEQIEKNSGQKTGLVLVCQHLLQALLI
jgi:membrane protease YdiL (CAAX protease family)